jgi:hypothetical protein
MKKMIGGIVNKVFQENGLEVVDIKSLYPKEMMIGSKDKIQMSTFYGKLLLNSVYGKNKIMGDTNAPCSKEDYEKANQLGLNLDDWNDYQKFYDMNKKLCDKCKFNKCEINRTLCTGCLDKIDPHRSCPNCFDDCQSWIVDAEPCGNNRKGNRI